MLDRKNWLVLAIAGVCVISPAARLMAAPPAPLAADVKEKDEDEKKSGDHEEMKGHDSHDANHEEDEDHEKKKEKEIEQAVPMNMVPTAVMEAVRKECPTGTVTEAELVAKHGKIMYSFDVKTPEAAYDVAISVDGKFISKKVDDDGDDEKDEKKDEKKADMPEKK